MDILHIAEPRNQVPVTSTSSTDGNNTIITARSATDKFTMKMLVTVLISLFLHTAKHTKMFPTTPTRNVRIYTVMRAHSPGPGAMQVCKNSKLAFLDRHDMMVVSVTGVGMSKDDVKFLFDIMIVLYHSSI